MTAHEIISGNELVQHVELKVKSLMIIISEIKQSSLNYEFDPSIRNDINEYIQIVETDCQTIINDIKNNLFSNKIYDKTQNIYDDKIMIPSIWMINNEDYYKQKMQKFEVEINFKVDDVTKSIESTTDILNAYYKENLLLNEQTNDIYQKLNLQKNKLNQEIDKFNNTDVILKNSFCKWKESLLKKNDENVLLMNEARKLIFKYQQNMLMVKNNIMNIVESVSKSMSLRAKCLQLEICLIWEGETILRMYKNIEKLIEVNKQKFDCYNDLQFQMGNINTGINKDLDDIKFESSKTISSISNQIQKYNNVKIIAEEKNRYLNELHNKIPVTEEILLHSLAYLKNIESEIKENEREIIIKRQKIDDENIKIKKLENICVDKNKIITSAQNEIKKKQSQLENIELKYKKKSKELENKRLEHQKKQTTLEIMNSIIKYHNGETKEKIQFYDNNIIRPLELKLEKCISLVDHEKYKINNMNTSVIEYVPEFKEKIEKVKSQIEQLDITINVQHGTVTRLEEDYKNIQLNVIRQTEINSIKAKKFIDNFGAIFNYWMKMLNVVEMREKNKLLDSKVFQKRYEIKKKREECLKREKELISQLDELKELVRQQATNNKRLGSFFIIGGDFNAKHTQWGSRYTNTRGRLFHTSILKNKLSFISPDEPTYWPAHENRSPDILDFFITSIPTGLKYHIKNLNELSSDHSPIQLTIGAFPASSPTTSLSSGPIDWKIFQQKLDISLALNFPLKRSSDIDNAISILTNSIQNAISTSSSPNPNKNQPKYPTSLPTYLVDLIKAKRQARSLWQRTKYPIHKTIYNHLITDLKTQLAKFRSEQFSKHLSTLTPNNGSLWKMTKKLINHRDNTPPLERPDKSLAISDLEKANLFCDHLSSSFSPHSDLASSPDHVNLVNSFLSSPLPMSLPAKSISPAEIVSVIHKLRPNKSPGHDQITNKIAKNLPKKAILFLTHIYNAMLRLSYFPPTWKYSIIIMISKPNKPKHLTSSYQPYQLITYIC
ncbi:hypothetical protein QTP88_025369 [Uroleucon formosanum]